MRFPATLGALILAWPVVALTLWALPVHADSRLPGARDLAVEAASSARDGRVVLVLFSQHGCPWCERVRREVLLPIQKNDAYRSRITFRQIDIDANAPLRDFRGETTTHAAFARAQGVRVYPTVILFGPDGTHLAEPLVGFTGSDFYGAYLDQRIEEATIKLRRFRS